MRCTGIWIEAGGPGGCVDRFCAEGAVSVEGPQQVVSVGDSGGGGELGGEVDEVPGFGVS
jgi:hypothetical protein